MYDTIESSAYPHPSEFQVMRPEYEELEEGGIRALITIAPFKVVGRSDSKSGARRAALYEAAKTYRNYHPSFKVRSPYPDVFTDEAGTVWERMPASQRKDLGDYKFEDEDGEDYADIEQMLLWDIRPAQDEDEDEDDE